MNCVDTFFRSASIYSPETRIKNPHKCGGLREKPCPNFDAFIQTHPMKTASYTLTPQQDGYLFHVTPAPKVVGGCAGVFFMLTLSALGAIICGAIHPGLGFIVFPTLLVLCLVKLDFRKKNHRHPSSFFVNHDAIQSNGQHIARSSIHRIIIRNAYDNTPRIVLTGQTISTGTAVGHDIRHMMEQISFSVDVEAGGKAVQLAGGMDEVTAFGLFKEVTRTMGLDG